VVRAFLECYKLKMSKSNRGGIKIRGAKLKTSFLGEKINFGGLIL
jgi:hypothetical protein